jgi:uncharacterized protein
VGEVVKSLLCTLQQPDAELTDMRPVFNIVRQRYPRSIMAKHLHQLTTPSKTVTAQIAGIAIAVFLAALAPAAIALQPQAPGKLTDEQLYGFIGKDPLPAGTVPWQLLRNVKLVEGKPDAKSASKKPTLLPQFSPQIQELDKKEVKIYGFVMPLSTGTKQKHFLISPLPSHCPFCVSQGPDSIVEVVAKTPVDYNQWEPIVVSGKLELVNDQYLFYRLTNAESVKF